MSVSDSLKPFFFDRLGVRGQIVRLDAAWRSVLARHDYPPPVRRLLGEAMAATAMLAASLKFEGKLTLQIQGEGPLNMLVMQCTSSMLMRGLARWRGEVPQGSFAEQVGAGRLAITIEATAEEHRYQGIVSLGGDTLAACLESYFETSEQLPTRLWLAAGESAAVGLLVQRLPAEHGVVHADEDGWNRVQLLADTVTVDELLSLEDTALLRRLFHEEDVRVLGAREVAFACSCSAARIETMLRSLGGEELRGILDEQGSIEVSCEFCNKGYAFDAVDVERLLAGRAGPDAPYTVH